VGVGVGGVTVEVGGWVVDDIFDGRQSSRPVCQHYVLVRRVRSRFFIGVRRRVIRPGVGFSRDSSSSAAGLNTPFLNRRRFFREDAGVCAFSLSSFDAVFRLPESRAEKVLGSGAAADLIAGAFFDPEGVFCVVVFADVEDLRVFRALVCRWIAVTSTTAGSSVDASPTSGMARVFKSIVLKRKPDFLRSAGFGSRGGAVGAAAFFDRVLRVGRAFSGC